MRNSWRILLAGSLILFTFAGFVAQVFGNNGHERNIFTADKIRTSSLVIVNDDGEEVGTFFAGKGSDKSVYLRLSTLHEDVEKRANVLIHVHEFMGAHIAQIEIKSPEFSKTGKAGIDLLTAYGGSSISLSEYTPGSPPVELVLKSSDPDKKVIQFIGPTDKVAWPKKD
jgi:hypothetical protein